jgi:hypothetical protein
MNSTTTSRLAKYRTADGTLWRAATADEVAAQIEHDATRRLSTLERSRPKRKSTRTHLDLVPLVGIKKFAWMEPHALVDLVGIDGRTSVIQVRMSDLEVL